ncbi:ABC transporter substrate-binding protein [Nodularia spumigena]|uniref:ABC transporter substrate-binding protein n=1 Tax=Nodularia spumigena TaxID=70799 RepID=UPI00232BAE70|nr:ABC transporter substrate-binding protein [Nodularia spumigena]MDB9316615.1 ABC transporter substrate-binding protein [Nodularia spumigena CS-590/01A]MDB9326650.1 ABC transporter substrate-binding protein [Nodularia spumigena CS-590/02]MDB9334147.1 ABC transporter substrate-binding protein [Nodularia spumigena CS-590/01]MDB9347006.1 ABC transporter substrate-binding protein [Nodularia spumigena CS-588/01]MDB9353991.1 ABC transporter substrate-binding protein [Nodularia spumigena CS-588/05]
MLNRQLNGREWIYLILSIILTVSISSGFASEIASIPNKFLCEIEKERFNINCQEKLISFGDKQLIPTDIEKNIKNDLDRNKFHDYKQQGIELFRIKAPANAVDKFQKAFAIYPDPETLIYKNNAQSQSHSHLQIAVSVPISHKLYIAEEILRGVAQAQEEINQSNARINRKWLQVGIADDKNESDVAKKIAEQATSNSNILAMVGHNASKISTEVADIYNDKKLVMVTPTSYDLNITNPQYEYIFKIVPNVNILVNHMRKYYNSQNYKHLFICFDSKEQVSTNFKRLFTDIQAKVVSEDDDCNVSKDIFQANTAISKAQDMQADSLLLATSVTTINSFIDLAKASKGRLALFSTSTLYTDEILSQAKEALKNMVLVTPWHPDAFANNPFPLKAEQMWKRKVNWRTAMAYDATKVIIEGLKRNPNREELPKELGKNICGATGEISFESGERQQPQAFIIKVVEDNDTGYDFILDSTAENNYGKSCNNQ